MTQRSILIIDDNLTNLRLAQTVLEIDGFETLTATNAEEALALLNQTTPSLILMDIQLPDIDGLTLTRQLRKNIKYRSVPIIAITAYALKGDREKALTAGCDDYMSKPININALSPAIRMLLQQYASFSRKGEHDLEEA